MIIDEDNYLAHYGILRKSGRYPWGSGQTQSGRNQSFLDHVEGLRKSGMSETDIAKGFGITTTELRAAKSIAKNEQKQAQISQAQRLKEHGYSNVEIGKRMEINESSVRSLLAPGQKDKADVLQATSDMLRNQVAEKGYIDVGTGVERHLAISDTKLKTAVAVLREEGYVLHYVKVQQLGTGQQTTIKVLSAPDVPYSEVFANRDKIRQITEFSEDGGRTYLGIKHPTNLSSKRVQVRFAEDGGTDADGVMYIRPGVKDLSLGASNYAQVRIAVDGTHYLKGMAMYKDDLPDGVDVLFNTNKGKDTPIMGPKDNSVLKPLKGDDDNPFGAVISRQSGVMNIVNEEGDWGRWSKSLSSQMLSKQSPNLAKTQLDMTFERKKQAFDEINALTNPAVKKKLLESLADDIDSSAVHLKAAALPRQASHVILPVNTLKENEIYAPNYRNGERVALVRYPHGGKFEIPELTVNNNHPDSKKALGRATDAVGINAKVAARLSGADFDGDTVLVIPNNNKQVKSEPALAGLKGFDGQAAYPAYPGMKQMSARTKQIEMGVVSNLITDMSIRGATSAELARAVRHSMVVIDAEKHNLNYRQSAVDNGIAALKAKYQTNADGSAGGASTLISRASSEIRVPEIKPRSAAKGGPIDKETGRLVFEQTGASYVNGKGQVVTKTTPLAKLAATSNANTLSSGTPIEKVYADHSNKLKSLANDVRRAQVNTKPTAYSPSAKAAYSEEVATLNAKLNVALRNKPMERQAQLVANSIVSAKKQANPNMEASELKKIKGQALTEARIRTGAKKERVDITPSEWAAIQAGAISNNKLEQIRSNADLDQVKALATPRTPQAMTGAKAARALSMLNRGYSQAEVADALGVSVTTLKQGIE